MFKITLNGHSMLSVMGSDFNYESIMDRIENNPEILNTKVGISMSMLEFNLLLQEEFGEALLTPMWQFVKTAFLDLTGNNAGTYDSLRFDAMKIMLTILNTYNTTNDINSASNTDYLFNRYTMLFYNNGSCCEDIPFHNSVTQDDINLLPATGCMSFIDALNVMANIVGIVKTLFVIRTLTYALRRSGEVALNDS